MQRCDNCGSDELFTDYSRGDCVCSMCGCVAIERLAVDTGRKFNTEQGALCFAAPHPNSATAADVVESMVSSNVRPATSQPYKRETYFSERISQWRQLEPTIPYHDFRDISTKWKRMTGYYEGDAGSWRWCERRNCYVTDQILTKEMCRVMLREIDEQRRANGESVYFVKKYLVSVF